MIRHRLALLAVTLAALTPSALAQCRLSSVSGSGFQTFGVSAFWVEPGGGSGILTLNFSASGCSWRVTSADSYVTFGGLSEVSGTQAGTSVAVGVDVAADSVAPRTTQLSVYYDDPGTGTDEGTSPSASWGVHQNSTDCRISSLSPDNVTVPASGGSGSFRVNVDPGTCWYGYYNPPSWVQTVPDSPSLYYISYTVSANTGSARSTTVDFANPSAASFIVNQDAAGPMLSLSCTPSTGPAVAGTPFSQSCDLSPSPAGDVTWTTSGLPAGLTITPDPQPAGHATISGTPTTAGPYSYMVTATLDQSQTSYSVTINGTLAEPLTLSCAPTTGPTQVGVSYSSTCTASGGEGGYLWTLTGPLPDGLTSTAPNASTRVISGTPTTEGPYTYTVQVEDFGMPPQVQAVDFSGTIAPAALGIDSPASLPDGVVSQGYGPVSFTASGGTTPYTWWATGLPGGLGINAGSGQLAGIPAVNSHGDYTPRFAVTDANSQTAFLTLSLKINPAALQITGPASLPSGTVGVAYGPVTFSATGGTGGYLWTATGLPSGLAFSPSGSLSGTPSQGSSGTYSPVFQVEDSSGNKNSVALDLKINPAQLQITGPASLPHGIVGDAYATQQFTASGGAGGYTWSATGLPGGMSITSGGALSGTPTQHGSFSPQFTVKDSSNATASVTLALTIDPAQLQITGPASLPDGVAGSAYATQQFTATGGTGGYTWSATGLPGGMSITSGGALSGTPTQSGSFSPQFTVRDSINVSASVTLNLKINPALLQITGPASLPDGVAGSAYSIQQFTATGGTGGYTWSASGLPGGMSITSGGALSGTPTQHGSFSPQFTVKDSSNATASVTLALTIAPAALRITSPSALTAAAVGQAYSPVQFTATGGTGGYQWSVSQVPSGMKFTSGGILSGTPVEGSQGSYSPEFTVRDSSNVTDSVTLPLDVESSDLDLSCNPPTGPEQSGVPYQASCFVSGGSAPYQWSITGELPEGLQFSSNANSAIVQGTPQGAGPYTYTIEVSDSSSPPKSRTRTYSGTLHRDLSLSCTPSIGPSMTGQSYSATCTASGGVEPYLWSITAGALPSGLSFMPEANTAVVAGTPDTPGPYEYAVRLQDSDNPAHVLTQSFSGTIQGSGSTEMILSVSPGRLQFTGRIGEPVPAQQSFSAFTSGGPANFTVAAEGGNWLSATTGDAATPGVVDVGVAIDGLAPDTYSGMVAVTAEGTTPARIEVPVTLILADATPPILEAAPREVQVSSVPGGLEEFLELQVFNRGGGELHFQASSETSSCGGWLSLVTLNGTATAAAPDTISYSIDPSGLPSGTCLGTIHVTSDGGQSQDVPLTLVISSGSQSLLLTQTGMQFQTETGSSLPSPKTVGVVNLGLGAMDFQVNVPPGAAWLSATPSVGSAHGGAEQASLVNVSADPDGLTPGEYYGSVEVTAPGAANSPKSVTVSLEVLPGGTPPDPEAVPGGLILFAGSQGTASDTAAVTLTNHADQPLAYSTTVSTLDGGPWLLRSPAGGTIPAQGTVEVGVQANIAGLGSGIRRGSLNIAFADGTFHAVSVALVVTQETAEPAPSRSLSALPPKQRDVVGTCNPGTDLAVVFQSPQQNQILEAQQPVTFEVLARDCQNRPVTPAQGGSAGAAVGVRLPAGNVSVPLAHKSNGLWTATWTPPVGASNVLLRAEVFQVPPSRSAVRGGAAEVEVEVAGADASAPAVVTQVLNAATNASSGQIAPGAWVALKGVALSGARAVADTPPYPVESEGTQVLMRNQPLPLYFVSEGQVNALIPSDLDAERQQLVVVRNGTRSAGIDVLVTDLQPGLFSLDSTGSGQGAIINALTGVLAGPPTVAPGAQPVHRGDFIAIFATGFGLVSGEGDPPAAGDQAPSSPLFRTVLTPVVRIGGVEASIIFSGLAPGLVGVYQINAAVPNLPASETVPVTVTIGNLTSNTVTFAIQ